VGRQIVAESETHTEQEEFHGSLPKGTRLRNYEVVSVLGHGAFGITYQARDTTLGRTVAIKEYLPTMLALRDGQSVVIPRSTELAEDFTWGRDRFLEEARILVTLDGVPSVVRVHDFLEANGTAYMVMGLVRGETLERRLKRERTLPAPVVEKLLYRLLDGLEQVHAAGFLHRDIKPANIILDAADNPTLIDFGASRASMADRTSAMTAIFTPRYAALEQLGSDKQGPWTDIYGLSVTLYYAVMGRAPPTAMERLSTDGYEPLSQLQLAGFAPSILRGIDAGLALRAADRPQSIADWRTIFASAADRASDATVVRSRKPSSIRPDAAHREGAQPPPMPARAASRSSGRALAVGGVMAACLLAVGGYFLAGPLSGLLRSDGTPTSESSQGVAMAPSDREAAQQKAAAEEAARAQAARVQAEQQKAEEAARQKAAAAEAARVQAERQKAEEAARQKAAAEEAARAQAERQKAEEAARQKAAAEEAARAQAERQKAEEAARQKAAAEEAARVQAERQKAEEAARQKAAAEEAARVQAERQKAEEAARQKAAAEEAARAQAERQKAEEAARQKAAAEEAARAQAARVQAEQQKAEEAARQKAAAEEAVRQTSNAQAGEAALGLTSADRQRLQFALTSLGFDTRGSDGVFGPRSREMIAAWQKQRGLPDTGYVSGEQQAALLREGASGVTKGLAAQAEQARKVTTKSSDASPPALPADQRCRTILQKAQLTGALGDDDRAYLKERCR
jgi:peptidoglycan hydrolase-like protein with peptidoglycan-binding domain